MRRLPRAVQGAAQRGGNVRRPWRPQRVDLCQLLLRSCKGSKALSLQGEADALPAAPPCLDTLYDARRLSACSSSSLFSSNFTLCQSKARRDETAVILVLILHGLAKQCSIALLSSSFTSSRSLVVTSTSSSPCRALSSPPPVMGPLPSRRSPLGFPPCTAAFSSVHTSAVHNSQVWPRFPLCTAARQKKITHFGHTMMLECKVIDYAFFCDVFVKR